MKYVQTLALATLAALSLTSAASALTFTDTVGSPTWLDATDWSSSNNSVSGWLDITTGQATNFNPASMVLTSASIAFAFADTYEPGGSSWYDEHDSWTSNGRNLETVTITLDALAFLSNVEVDGTHSAYDWASASGNLTGSLLATLQDNGTINYKVKIKTGDVWFKRATLNATGNYRQVPDAGSTAVLLGLGLLGFAGFARRK